MQGHNSSTYSAWVLTRFEQILKYGHHSLREDLLRGFQGVKLETIVKSANDEVEDSKRFYENE